MDSNPMDDHEKRRSDRKQLYFYLKAIHDSTGRIAGYLGDISTSGLMLFSREKMEPGQEVVLRINLDKELEMQAPLVFEARSLWCEKDANPEFFIIGYEFIDLGQDELDTVKYLIKKIGFTK